MQQQTLLSYGDILGITGRSVPEDPFAAQLLWGFQALMDAIKMREGKPRYFTEDEIAHVHTCLAAHEGNPLSFAFLAEQRKSPDEDLPFVTQPLSPFYDRVMVGEFDEQTNQFYDQPSLPTHDARLHVTINDVGSFRHWKFRIPAGYPLSIVLGKYHKSYVHRCRKPPLFHLLF